MQTPLQTGHAGGAGLRQKATAVLTRAAGMAGLLGTLAMAEPAHESLWIEAEHLDGIEGYVWPMHGNAAARASHGAWGLSGPGWAAEWNMGGESGFLSIAVGAGDDAAEATAAIEVPRAGMWYVWVRYRDGREKTNRFRVAIEQPGREEWSATYGTRPVVDEDNELKLYFGWAFGWEGHAVELDTGPASLALRSAYREPDNRQVDVIVLTTDPDYRPMIKERPAHPTWAVLDRWRKAVDGDREPLARRVGAFSPPEGWAPRTFNDGGFLYLWNMDNRVAWASDDPDRVPVPCHVRDADVIEAVERKYAGRDDVPIFADPRIVPTFHSVGPRLMQTDAENPAIRAASERFVNWLQANPERAWALMINYYREQPLTEVARDNFLRFADRFVGSVSGESLGYFRTPADVMTDATADASSYRELVGGFTPVDLAANEAKWRTALGDHVERLGNPYETVISAKSVGMTAFAPVLFGEWGARMVGYESAVMTSGLLGMRWAFLRGAARQYGGMTATYRSCNFGDSATLFSETQSYTSPRNILDNYYSVYSGAGMTWYRFDIWYAYHAGSSVFYHEQGFDEYWIPGGTSAAGRHEVQLSPKGRLVDRFLRVTAAHPDRGTPVTPVAFLLDYAHGWDPTTYTPHAFGGHARRPDLTRYAAHERMLHEYFHLAYHPIGPNSERPINALNEVYPAAVFGDIFDVVFAHPDTNRWTTLDGYPVVIAAGDIPITDAEGRRLAAYVERGGTLLVADDHLTGPGVAHLDLPAMGERRVAGAYRWLDGEPAVSQRFRYRPLTGGRPLAVTPDGDVFAAAFDRGEGRLIVLSVPRGLGIDQAAVPVLAHLVVHLSRGLMPVEVSGDVQWAVNRLDGGGWLVLLLNPYGQLKPQQGITPTDYRENRAVILRAAGPLGKAFDRLMPTETLTVRPGEDGVSEVSLTVPAGGVRWIELR